MDKNDYIESIIMLLKSTTGYNYQQQIKVVLSEYYKSIGKSYECPSPYGGDDKNDGAVISDGIFYQIYAPVILKGTLKKDINKKFKEDLEGLLKLIYKEKKWGGKLNEFIFIVNTHDTELPHDSERHFDITTEQLKKDYSIEFNYTVVNTDYIRDILYKISDVEILERISSIMRISNLCDYNAVTETVITDLIIGISSNITEKYARNDLSTSYERISSPKKIKINDLTEIKDEIDNIISKLDVVENAINRLNQDILYADKFQRVKNFIIDKYNIFSKTKNGKELYEILISDTLSCRKEQWRLEISMKFLIIYIFDKCDIFEKMDNLE